LLLIVFCNAVNAQDPVLSQPFVASQYLSPASVGSGGYAQRIQNNVRSQFIDGINLYRTVAMGWDTRFNRRDPELINYMGIGAQIMSDQVMGGIMQTNYFTMNMAYHLFLDKQDYRNFSLGLGVTFSQISLDKSKLRFGDQYDYAAIYTGNSSLESLRPFPSKFSVNSGLLYTVHNEQSFMQLGVNAFYYSKPEFISLSLNQNAGLKASSFINLEKVFPNAYTLVLHGSYTTKDQKSNFFAGGAIGLPFNYKMDEVRRLYLGCFYRVGDAIIPTVSLMLNKYSLGLSYDIYNNDISAASMKQNGFEITLSSSFGEKRNNFLRTLFD